MRISSFLFPLSTFLLITSCEKDIHIDYHQAEPVYVVEASISTTGTEVRISQTQAMDDNSTSSDISGATVTITGDDGTNQTIPYSKNGFYTSRLKGTPGIRYQLDVTVDAQHFTSTSTMQQMPQLKEMRLVWKKVLTERFLFVDVRLKDLPNEDNWYFVHLYRNGIGYRWAVIRDDRNPGKELQQLLSCFREGSHDSDEIHEGDKLHLVVRAIDQRSYDYLYSMERMDDTGTNPVANFTGGCLGYFSAYSETFRDCVFQLSDVTEDDGDS